MITASPRVNSVSAKPKPRPRMKRKGVSFAAGECILLMDSRITSIESVASQTSKLNVTMRASRQTVRKRQVPSGHDLQNLVCTMPHVWPCLSTQMSCTSTEEDSSTAIVRSSEPTFWAPTASALTGSGN